MKKFLALVISLAFVFSISGCVFSDVCLNYTEHVSKNGFEIWVNEKSNRCFVGPYFCTNYTPDLVITIPDDYEGIPVTRIGGTFGRGVPTPFYIDISDLYVNAPSNSKYKSIFSESMINHDYIEEDYQVEELRFILNIGKNIKEIYDVGMQMYYPHINDDGSITFYHSVVYIICSDENQYFYSENGKLYDKKTDELISDFEYSS